MHDMKWIRENPAAFDAGMQKRGLDAVSGDLLALDEQVRALQTQAQELQAKGNALAKEIPAAIKRGEDIASIKEEGKRIKEQVAELNAQVTAKQDELADALAGLPNLPMADVPEGKDEADNKEIRQHGQKPDVANPKQHFDLGEALGMMDFERAAKMSGSRFVVLSRDLAKLERAMAAFFLDHNVEQFGYEETVPPFLVWDSALFGTSQLPKFEEDLFKTGKSFDSRVFWADYWQEDEADLIALRDRWAKGERINNEEINKISLSRQRKWIERARGDEYKKNLYLIPTAEVPLTNLVADEILSANDLPRRFTAYTPCFRSEAGSAGKDTRGMIRQHQFSKVEMVSVTHPDKSDEELERMTSCAESLLQKLGLHYRVMLLCAGDMGFGARKTYDIEVWLPGQEAYREISSCSNCGDFQARRMKARFRPEGEKGTQFVHTLNGSGLPIGRTMVAILENYQQADGSIAVPDVLQPYMGGKKVIGGKG